MDTQRLYHDSPYLQQFNACIIRTVPDDRGYGVILDQTAFYPASGGQPADRGTLNAVPVLDVLEKDTDIIHITPEWPEGPVVKGRIDWLRRFDHMQQHSGQHILSQALLQTAGAHTTSFHLSEQTVSIDLDVPCPAPLVLQAAEQLANESVFANIPVEAITLSPAEAVRLPWRSEPPLDCHTIRGIRIGTYDLCGCGGTHVSATGEIGMIKILRCTSARTGSRIYFLCGLRALNDYRQKNDQINVAARIMGAQEEDLARSVQQWKHDRLQDQKKKKNLIRAMDQMTADALWENAPTVGAVRLVSNSFSDCSLDRLKEIAAYLTRRTNTIALLAAADPKSALVFSRSSELNLSMAELLKQVLAPRDGRSGGHSQMAQGGGVDPAHIPNILAQAREIIDI